ncbi:MAG: 2-hydroxyacid dehydrogenase, partial [Monoglobaceae bacterium]
VAAAMTLICHMPQYMEYVENGDYTKSGVANRLVPVYHEICGRTWGIVGGGNIGRKVAGIAEAMGCRVIVNKRTPSEDMECVDIDTLCRTSDIISVHTPLTEETRGMINRERIALMKSDTVFINMARGAVADEAALTEAIEQGRLGGLAVDVYTTEPLPEKHPYQRILKHPNTCFTPHNAWGAYEARLRCLETISKNIKSYIEGRCENRIDL